MEREVPLSEAMEKQNKVFPPMLVNMVEAGETSGSIDKSLERMAIQFEKKSQVKGHDETLHDVSDGIRSRGTGDFSRYADICYPKLYGNV